MSYVRRLGEALEIGPYQERQMELGSLAREADAHIARLEARVGELEEAAKTAYLEGCKRGNVGLGEALSSWETSIARALMEEKT